MIFPRGFAFKALVAVGVGAGIGYSAWYFKDPIFEVFGVVEPTLLEGVGLKCNEEGVCTPIGEDTKINVKQGEIEEESKTLNLNGAKLKLHALNEEDTNYPGNIKLTVEGGDITLAPSASITKLSRYESYAVEKVKGSGEVKYFLKRVRGAEGGMEESLGISFCTLPTSSTSECSDIDGEKLKLINFKGGGATITSGSAKLTIAKLSAQENEFPYGYRVTLESPSNSGDITIPGDPRIVIKSGEKMEFKIRKEDNSEALSLERAWDLASLMKKVGLKDCTLESPECSVEEGRLNVRKGNDSAENKTKQSTSSGKIKVYGAEGYNEGFKFAIEEGDIALSNSGTPSKLEEFETYEITSEGDKYFLTRKESSLEGKWRLLGLPKGENCRFPDNAETLTCALDRTKVSSIRFDGKTEGGEVTITGEDGNDQFNLKVSKVSTSPFRDNGYRFVLESNRDITVPKSSGNITIKKKTNTEFRLKITTPSSGGAKTLSLEKAWDVEDLAQKSGFSSCWGSGPKKCTFKTEIAFNVLNGTGENEKINDAKVTDSDKNMSVEVDQEGYNQGFKFSTDSDINVGTGKKIHKKETGTYEIIEKTDNGSAKWYLSKKG